MTDTTSTTSKGIEDHVMTLRAEIAREQDKIAKISRLIESKFAEIARLEHERFSEITRRQQQERDEIVRLERRQVTNVLW